MHAPEFELIQEAGSAKQRRLNPGYQRTVIDTAARMYPGVTGIEFPLLIALPAGIHPYNRASAYYDLKGNAIVLYQKLGNEAISGKISLSTVQHEIAHWYQRNVLGERAKGSTNVHRLKSWQEACYIATCNLWPELEMTRDQFRPYTSKRVDGQVKRIPKPGSLTDVQLHHWPRSLEGRIADKPST